MSDAFNPYHKWLGIPPEEQPADHYRLLGVERFESDPDVITGASDQRMQFLLTMQTGEHSKLVDKLLNEIANAKACLLNKEKKAAYDKRLRAKTAVEEKRPESTAKPLFKADAKTTTRRRGKQSAPPSAGEDARETEPSRRLMPIIALAVVALAIIGGAITFYLIGEANKQEQRLAQVAEEKAAQAEDEAKAQAAAARIEAKKEEDRKAKEEEDRKAKEEADRKAKEEADRKEKEEADRKTTEEAERKEAAADKAAAERIKAKKEEDRKAEEEADRKVKVKEKQQAAKQWLKKHFDPLSKDGGMWKAKLSGDWADEHKKAKALRAAVLNGTKTKGKKSLLRKTIAIKDQEMVVAGKLATLQRHMKTPPLNVAKVKDWNLRKGKLENEWNVAQRTLIQMRLDFVQTAQTFLEDRKRLEKSNAKLKEILDKMRALYNAPEMDLIKKNDPDLKIALLKERDKQKSLNSLNTVLKKAQSFEEKKLTPRLNDIQKKLQQLQQKENANR